MLSIDECKKQIVSVRQRFLCKISQGWIAHGKQSLCKGQVPARSPSVLLLLNWTVHQSLEWYEPGVEAVHFSVAENLCLAQMSRNPLTCLSSWSRFSTKVKSWWDLNFKMKESRHLHPLAIVVPVLHCPYKVDTKFPEVKGKAEPCLTST